MSPSPQFPQIHVCILPEGPEERRARGLQTLGTLSRTAGEGRHGSVVLLNTMGIERSSLCCLSLSATKLRKPLTIVIYIIVMLDCGKDM